MIGKLDMTGRTIYENTAIAKLNEVIDVVNRLEESIQGVVNNSIADGGRGCAETNCRLFAKQNIFWNSCPTSTNQDCGNTES